MHPILSYNPLLPISIIYIYINNYQHLEHLKNIWRKTYLGKLLSTDPKMGRILTLVLVVYVCIHVFRLEMFPLYMFAMYSKKETPKEIYTVYKFYDKNKEINPTDLDFRKYIVLTNTIQQYNGILEHNMIHPEALIIDKFIDRLHLQETSLHSKLKESFVFSKQELELQVRIWISSVLEIKNRDLRIVKESYNWESPAPHLINKDTLYGVD